MLTAEERQELEKLRARWNLMPSMSTLPRLIELERKDVDPAAGPPFSRGLPSVEERIAHPGPWESWESPNDRCLVWFSPDGSGYDVDYGSGEERKFHPVTAANWSDTWLRRLEQPKAPDFDDEPTKERKR